jgi:hypothetical protein
LDDFLPSRLWFNCTTDLRLEYSFLIENLELKNIVRGQQILWLPRYIEHRNWQFYPLYKSYQLDEVKCPLHAGPDQPASWHAHANRLPQQLFLSARLQDTTRRNIHLQRRQIAKKMSRGDPTNTSTGRGKREGGERAEQETSPTSGSSRASSGFTRLFSIPTPIRMLFDSVPVVVYEPNGLPQRASRETRLPTLYIFSTEKAAAAGRPSFNPSCLKWQVGLQL